MSLSEPSIHASPLAVQNVRSIISAYNAYMRARDDIAASPSDKANELRVAFLKAFAGLFQKRVQVEIQANGRYLIDATPGVLDLPLSRWLNSQVVRSTPPLTLVAVSDQSCALCEKAVASLIEKTDVYLNKHYSQIYE